MQNDRTTFAELLYLTCGWDIHCVTEQALRGLNVPNEVMMYEFRGLVQHEPRHQRRRRNAINHRRPTDVRLRVIKTTARQLATGATGARLQSHSQQS